MLMQPWSYSRQILPSIQNYKYLTSMIILHFGKLGNYDMCLSIYI